MHLLYNFSNVEHSWNLRCDIWYSFNLMCYFESKDGDCIHHTRLCSYKHPWYILLTIKVTDLIQPCTSLRIEQNLLPNLCQRAEIESAGVGQGGLEPPKVLLWIWMNSLKSNVKHNIFNVTINWTINYSLENNMSTHILLF